MPSDDGERHVNSGGEGKTVGEALGEDRPQLGLIRQSQLGQRALGRGGCPAVRFRQSCQREKFGKRSGSYE